MLLIRPLRSGPSALLKTTVTTLLLLGAAAAGAQTPDVSAARANAPASTNPAAPAAPPAASDSNQVGYRDLVCKPNGTEDTFDCANVATPAKIVPVPWQVVGPRPQDQPVTG
jgi:hypothetical protein